MQNVNLDIPFSYKRCALCSNWTGDAGIIPYGAKNHYKFDSTVRGVCRIKKSSKLSGNQCSCKQFELAKFRL